MSDYQRLEIGDTVTVNVNAAQITLSHKAILNHIPQQTGDSWVFTDCETAEVFYCSEGCTVSRKKIKLYDVTGDHPVQMRNDVYGVDKKTAIEHAESLKKNRYENVTITESKK